MHTGRKLVVAAAVVLALAACHAPNAGSMGEQGTTTNATVAASASPATASPSSSTAPATTEASLPVTTTAVATPGSSQPSLVDSMAPMFEEVPAPAGATSFTLRVEGSEVRVPDIPVGVINTPPHTLVQPAEPDGPDWMNTTVYPSYSAYPSAPAMGTTFVYGHACLRHDCPFTSITQQGDGYTIRTADLAVVTTQTGVLTYEVCAVGLSPKSGDLQVPRGDCQYQPALVLVTCHYEDNVSDYNVVVALVPKGSAKA